MIGRRVTVEQQARESVQARLGAISLAVWFAVSFGLVLLLTTPHVSRAPVYLQIGFVALLVAAVPWLGYRAWVAAEVRRRRAGASESRREYQ